MRPLILVTPMAENIPMIEGADYVGIDAGILQLLKEGITPMAGIGDFDSVKEEEKNQLLHLNNLLKYPVEKDETDTELALMKYYDNKYSPIILYGAFGGRLDHTLANLSLMIYHYPKMVCMSQNQKAYILETGKHHIKPVYKHISFFALEPSLVQLEDFQYELPLKNLLPKEILTVSNSFIEKKEGIVKIVKGRLLCVESNNP